MKRLTLFFWFVFSFSGINAQDFLHSSFDKSKNYILLANPTTGNIKTIEYLVNHQIFKINPDQTSFIGVYFDKQTYDFTESAKYIANKKLTNFYLQKFTGDLNEKNIYQANDCSEMIRDIFLISKGIIFFGGPDIQPVIYGEENSKSEVTDPGRHLFETTFLFQLLGSSGNETYKPLLEEKPAYVVTGFCLGLQTMNVATGGTLIQDIPDEIYHASVPTDILKTGKKNLHRNYWQEMVEDSLIMGINFHPVRFNRSGFFQKRAGIRKGMKPVVLSSHHQAVEKTGKGLIITALSSDGKIVEGLAHEKYPNVFSVQFHPEVPALYENMYSRKFAPGDKPKTYHDIIGKRSLKFHKKYWSLISQAMMN